MSEAETGKFITSINETLTKNGYPEKKVALPLEKMYESAYNKGVNFNKVLEFLKEKGIYHTKTDEKIIFTNINPNPETVAEPAAEPVTENPMGAFGNIDMSMFQNMNMAEMMQSATEMMKNMSPEQMMNIKDQLSSLSPDQIESMKGMFSGLSEDQKKDLMEKAKNLKS